VLNGPVPYELVSGAGHATSTLKPRSIKARRGNACTDAECEGHKRQLFFLGTIHGMIDG
jgi:hypothetical protein